MGLEQLPAPGEPARKPLRLSVVVPVYQGEQTIGHLVDELAALTSACETPRGRQFHVAEVVLVDDGSADASAEVIESLAARYRFVNPVWLSRNYGQHAATLAGMGATTGEFVVTMDEDGRHDPADIGGMLDIAIDARTSVVYAQPLARGGGMRRALGRWAKAAAAVLSGDARVRLFQSYRLIVGEIARSMSAFCGPGVYFDVALSWMVDGCEVCPAHFREGDRRPSGYDLPKLFSHFWCLVFSDVARPMKAVTLLASCSLVVAFSLACLTLAHPSWAARAINWIWLPTALGVFGASTLVLLSVSLGYLRRSLEQGWGKPNFLIVSQPIGRSRKPG